MDYNYEYVNCNICGSSEYELISEKGQFSLPLHVVLCNKCGLGYLNPRWDEDTYLNFYQNEYDKYYRPQFFTKQQEKNPIIIRLKQNDLLPANLNSVLDIGSGAGQNLLDFKELYPSSTQYAIEPSKEAQIFLKNNGIKILDEDASTNWDQKCSYKFDLIIMRHVLEHFLDPKKILTKVRSVLSDNGLLYLAVPNCLSPQKPLGTHWFRVVHTYYFNKYSLNNILALNDLKSLGLFEGDDFNNGEIFSFLNKSNQKIQPDISKQHYYRQKEVFNKRIIKEDSFIYRIKRIIKKGFKKIIK